MKYWIGLCMLGLLLTPGCTSDDASAGDAGGGAADAGDATDGSSALLSCMDADSAATRSVLERAAPLAA
ncbi:MAG: hypothetical protein GXP55_13540, partial [Deltaproteobacteria bacterium]|nr:hypothetical protein [Deltaproteobacteria bacterium]